jgi:hypothetical protein
VKKLLQFHVRSWPKPETACADQLWRVGYFEAMARQDALRRKLFDEGVSAAAKALGLVNLYVCPICAQQFDETALTDRRLTLEDVPPKAAGGRPIILTCKTCNNTAGHLVDSQAAKRASLRSAVASLLHDRAGMAGSADLFLGDAKIRVALAVDDQKVREMKVVAAWNNPATVEEFAAQMKRHIDDGTTDGLKLQISLRESFVPRLAWVSDLRAAFLACAAAIGYTYAGHPSLEVIRKQILEPKLELLPRWWFRTDEVVDALSIYVSISEGIAVVRLHEWFVALPWPSRKQDRYFQLLDDLQGNRHPITIADCKFVGWPRSFVARLDHRNRPARTAGS